MSDTARDFTFYFLGLCVGVFAVSSLVYFNVVSPIGVTLFAIGFTSIVIYACNRPRQEITMANTNHCPKCGALIEFAQCDYRICNNCDWRGDWTDLIVKSYDPPTPKFQYVLEEIKVERRCQVRLQYSGNTEAHDENLTPNDWVAVICAYAGRAAQKVDRNVKESCSFRRSMISVAALAVAAIETQDKIHA